MSKYLTITLSLLLILSCSSDAETVNEVNSVTEADAVEFLAEVEERAKTEGPIYSSAFWIQSNFITYDSQRVAADYSKRGTLIALEQARIASSFDESIVYSGRGAAKNNFMMDLILSYERENTFLSSK